MDLITSIMVLVGMILGFAILIALWRLGEEYRPEKLKAGDFVPVRPRRQGFDQVYRPIEGVTYEIISSRPYSDGSFDFRLKHGRRVITAHYTKHQLAPKGGNFLNFLAPGGARVAIELDGHIMNDSVLAEAVYDGQWEDLLRDYIHWRKEAETEKMKRESLEVNFEDRVKAEVLRSTTDTVPKTIKATLDAVMKHG